MHRRLGLIVLIAAVACQAQYWKGRPDNRDIMADYMDYGVPSPKGILKGKPINFIISGYSTMIPCVADVVYLLAQHEKSTGTTGLYNVIDACKAGSSLLNYVGCPPAYSEGANYRLPLDKLVKGQTNILLAEQSPSGLCAATCSADDKGTDNIAGLDDPMAERYAVYMDTVTTRYLRDGFDKVYFNTHLYYSGRQQGMCFQWYGMYKFFRDHPKQNVFPGPYSCGVAEGFYPTGYQDTNHPTSGGVIAKIVGLGWYIAVAGEDAQDAVMKPYLDAIAAAGKGAFPARDYTATGTTVQSKTLHPDLPVSIAAGAVSIKTNDAHAIGIVNLNGKTVYGSFGSSAGNFRLPRLEPGVYVVKVKAGSGNFSGSVAVFNDRQSTYQLTMCAMARAVREPPLSKYLFRFPRFKDAEKSFSEVHQLFASAATRFTTSCQGSASKGPSRNGRGALQASIQTA
jgi:hypothetical protein